MHDKTGDVIFWDKHPRVKLREARELLNTAKVLGLDSDLRVFHRFDKLRVFYILRLQRRLSEMTEKLEEMVPTSKDIMASDETALKDKDEILDKFIQDMESTLKEYDNALAAQDRIEGSRKPEDRFLTSFMRDLAVAFPMLCKDLERDSKFRLNTLVATPIEAKSWFHRFIGHHPFLATRFGTEFKRPKEEEEGREVPELKDIMIYSDQKVRRADQIFMNVSFCLLLLCPVIVLSLVDNRAVKLSVVVGFLLFCAVLLAIGTSSNNSALAVLAGYGAFLIFFLGLRVDSS